MQSTKLCIVSLHGRFGSGRDGIALGAELARATEGNDWAQHVSVLGPSAPGNKWYPHSFLFPREKNEPNAWQSIAFVTDELLPQLRQALPAQAALVLCGFSQGACLTTEVLAAIARKTPSTTPLLHGAAVFTGGLMGDDDNDASSRVLPQGALALKDLPIAMITGDPDAHVPVIRVQETAKQFQSLGAKVLLHITQGKRHVVLPEEVKLAADWLRTSLRAASR